MIAEKSNVTAISNIYVRTGANLQTDDDFIRSVYGHKALNILKQRFPKSYAQRMTKAQIEEMKQNVLCRNGKGREYVYGKALVNGKVVWSCRCENIACYSYERCMSLPNALRIDRNAAAEQEEEAVSEYGFDYEKCNFEPAESAQASYATSVESAEEQPEISETYRVYGCFAEKPEFSFPDGTSVIIVCETAEEADYFNSLLYREGINCRSLHTDGYTLHRWIADMFWDYCAPAIELDPFTDRYIARVGGDEEEARDVFRALLGVCGSGGDKLIIARLADALNGSGAVSEFMLNTDADYTGGYYISTLDKAAGEYDIALVLEGNNTFAAVKEVKKKFPAAETAVIEKENPAAWLFTRSESGRGARISYDNYKGEKPHCLNVALGLWGDVDCKSFLKEETGDAIRLQLYIAEKVKPGDKLTIEKNADINAGGGSYSIFHNGFALGAFPEAPMREIMETEGFPDDFKKFDGVFVRNIITCVGDRDDTSLPERFRNSRVWLGIEITGYGRVVI